MLALYDGVEGGEVGVTAFVEPLVRTTTPPRASLAPRARAGRRTALAPPEDCSLPKELAAARLRQEKEATEDAARGLRRSSTPSGPPRRRQPDPAIEPPDVVAYSSIVVVTYSPSGSMALPSAYSSVARG